MELTENKSSVPQGFPIFFKYTGQFYAVALEKLPSLKRLLSNP